jgi:putative heme-binding domain-containing protein
LSIASAGSLPIELKGMVSDALHRSPDKKVREAAAATLPLPKLADKRPLPPLDNLLNRPGDAKRGEAVFFKPEAQCAKCHRVAGIGSWIGPDLSQVGGKLGKDGLLESLLYPSSAIAHEYVQYDFLLKSGQLITGLIVEENAERVVLKDAEGIRRVIVAREVESKSPRHESIMPERLTEVLTDQELVDLLAYLTTLKQPAFPINTWNVIGPLAADATINVDKGVDLKATYSANNGDRATWRKLVTDREGRLDLETALGVRDGVAFLHAVLESKTDQTGRLVVLVPAGLEVSGWLGGKKLKWESRRNRSDESQSAFAAEAPLMPGRNEVVLKVAAHKDKPLAIIATIISSVGVELK